MEVPTVLADLGGCNRTRLMDLLSANLSRAVRNARSWPQVEIIHMRHKSATDSTLIKGIVMDHGARHPDMPRTLKK